MIGQFIKEIFKPFDGPLLEGPTRFRYSQGMIGRLVFIDDANKYCPYFREAKRFGLIDGEEIIIRPSKCLLGIIRPSLNYEIFRDGKWHRVQVIK
ncbi:hypothetical protein SG34_007090 [Thalassomonas viridans]|uniref:Uncharacterized protein n=1 Tax=Thalassomonas viridans TaxID=137584 RepID=A0AAE9Z5Z7_9GAMM|nr:hypothetical protein [Thalassomonas viridans]WDE06665.1 hypothetical protein SG34_007090 [Thalassomonas viridans]